MSFIIFKNENYNYDFVKTITVMELIIKYKDYIVDKAPSKSEIISL